MQLQKIYIHLIIMGFFTKDKPIDCYKKVNKLIKKMYEMKKLLILNIHSFNEIHNKTFSSLLTDLAYLYDDIERMDFHGQYINMRFDVWNGSSVVDYEAKRMSIKEFMDKTAKEIENFISISKGAPLNIATINPRGISNDFFYNQHKLGVENTIFINSPLFQLPPMFYV